MHHDTSLLKILDEDRLRQSDSVILACEKGDLKGLRSLLAAGVNLSACVGLDGYTPLHHACSRGHGALIPEILKAGIDVNCKNNAGETPLHLACYSGFLLVVEQLIDSGALLDIQNSYYETPLFYASRRSQPAVVRILIQRGANTDMQDELGETAKDHAPDPRTRSVFESVLTIENATPLSYEILLKVFSYLTVVDIGRSACVNGKWHRVSESPSIWSSLGVRRWEYALQSSLGFGPAPAACYKPRGSSREKEREKVKVVNKKFQQSTSTALKQAVGNGRMSFK